MPRDRLEHRNSAPSKAAAILGKINSDIRALNSSILIISQKMRYFVRNEKILGRNLLVLNKKLKEFEANFTVHNGAAAISEEVRQELAKINGTLASLTDQVVELQSKVEQMNDTYAKAEELKEIKYVIDAIDPLQFVTRKDLEEITGRTPSTRKAKK